MRKVYWVAVFQSWGNLVEEEWTWIAVQSGGCRVPLCRVWSPQPPSGRAALDPCRAGGRREGMMSLYQLENDAFWGPGDLDRDNMRVLSCLKTLSLRGMSVLVCITPKNSLPPNAGCQKGQFCNVKQPLSTCLTFSEYFTLKTNLNWGNCWDRIP